MCDDVVARVASKARKESASLICYVELHVNLKIETEELEVQQRVKKWRNGFQLQDTWPITNQPYF